jgi:hypothetical protein
VGSNLTVPIISKSTLSLQSFSHPGGMSPTIQNGMNENYLFLNRIKHGKREALGQKAVLLLVRLAMDAAIKPQ